MFCRKNYFTAEFCPNGYITPETIEEGSVFTRNFKIEEEIDVYIDSDVNKLSETLKKYTYKNRRLTENFFRLVSVMKSRKKFMITSDFIYTENPDEHQEFGNYLRTYIRVNYHNFKEPKIKYIQDNLPK
jgi:hypothetical protein